MRARIKPVHCSFWTAAPRDDRVLQPTTPPALIISMSATSNHSAPSWAKEKKQCKKTCDLCDALPPSAPPPSVLAEDKCGGRTDANKCKIKDCEKVQGKCKKQCKKCKKQCKKNKLKNKCEKTCCDAGF